MTAMKRQTKEERQVWVVLFQGFTQDASRSTGLENVWKKLGDYRCFINREIKDWHSRTGPLAERIWRLTRDDENPPIIFVGGYSYGATTGLLFCKELAKRGLMVHSLHLSDGVWRPLRRIPSLTSLLHRWSLTVPSNVKNVWIYRQENNTPRGHNVKLKDATATRVVKQFTAKNTFHQYMDDLPEFQEDLVRTVNLTLMRMREES